MGKIRLKLIKNQVTPSLKKKVAQLNKVPKEAYDKFKATTPIKTGNARRRTRLQGDTIKADYQYATELDDGKSRQAPEGMTKPTERFITKRVKDIMRKP